MDLAAGAEADVFGDGGVGDAEGSAGGGQSERLVGLEQVGADAEGVVEARRRVGEVGAVEEVVELGAEFEADALGEAELLLEREVELGEAGAVKRPAAQVAEFARGGNEKAAGLR